jgi:hypothetical protein
MLLKLYDDDAGGALLFDEEGKKVLVQLLKRAINTLSPVPKDIQSLVDQLTGLHQ